MSYELVDPRGEIAARPVLPERTIAPAGATAVLGFLANEASRAIPPDFLGYTEALERAARKTWPELTVVRDAKPMLSRAAEPDMLAKFRHCRGVVSGLAR